MGLFDKLRGKRPALAVADGMLVIRTREIAESLRRPADPNFATATQPPCEKCGKPLAELFLTTGGPLGDAELWRDVPVAVDGWACVDCGVLRYPRVIAPAQITEWMAEGNAHGQAGRFGEAELCFTRIAWAWPGYLGAHLNLAEATRERLHHDPPADEGVRRRLELRMLDEYERAIEAYVEKPEPASAVRAIARACLTIAELAAKQRSHDRARRFAAICLALPGLPDEPATAAREIDEYVRTRRDLFFDAADMIGPRMRLMDRPAKPPTTGEERRALAIALEQLEEHLALDPERWQSLLVYCKGLHLAGRDDDAFAAWERAFARHAGERQIAQDYGYELLVAGRVSEARDVAGRHAALHPDDPHVWGNLATSEVLCGDLDAADASLARCAALDPDDIIVRNLRVRIDGYRAGKPLPRTMQELERG